MDKFLEIYNVPRLNQEETENLYRLYYYNQWTEWISNLNFPTKKSPDDFIGKFYQTFKELTPIVLKFTPKTEREETLPNSFYEATITLIPKPDKDTTRKKKTLTNQ